LTSSRIPRICRVKDFLSLGKKGTKTNFEVAIFFWHQYNLNCFEVMQRCHFKEDQPALVSCNYSQLTLRYFNDALNVKSFQINCCYCFSIPPNRVHFKLAGVMVYFHSHLLLVILPSSIKPESLAPIFVYKVPPSMNKQFSLDSFLEREGHHWVLVHYNKKL